MNSLEWFTDITKRYLSRFKVLFKSAFVKTYVAMIIIEVGVGIAEAMQKACCIMANIAW